MSKFNEDKNSHRLGVKELVNKNNFNDKMLKYCQRHLPCDLHEACDDVPCNLQIPCDLHKEQNECLNIEENSNCEHKNETVCNSIQENIEFEVKPKLIYKFKKSKSIKW